MPKIKICASLRLTPKQLWWKTRMPKVIGKIHYFLLNTPGDENQDLYINTLKHRARSAGLLVDVEIVPRLTDSNPGLMLYSHKKVPNLASSPRSAFRSGFKRETSSSSKNDLIVIGSHGCDCFTCASIVVETKHNGASIIHSVDSFIEQLGTDSGRTPKPVFLDSCVSGRYPYGEYAYPEMIEGHIDAPTLADAQTAVIDFALIQTFAKNLLVYKA